MALSPVGEVLRSCRGAHGMSQLELAVAAGVSSRHISFIETGRSRPSREMVLRLAETLGLGLRRRNALLAAAGFAPLYAERDLGAADIAPVRRALETILHRHEPYPAFVLDARWNILLANRAHETLLARLLPDALGRSGVDNAIRLTLDPALLRPRIENWSEVAHVLGHRVLRAARPAPPEVRRSLEALIDYEGVRAAMDAPPPPPEAEVVLPMRIRHDGATLGWFSTIATIGTPRDVTVDELSIETLFPADETTAAIVARLAG